MRAPVLVQGITLNLSLSIGIAHAPEGDVSHLLRNADTAMHRAKGRGKSGWAMFEKAMDNEILERFEQESALRQALDRGEISLYFQPIYSLKTGAVVALEGLARWREGDAAFKNPGQFIALAEEIGLIVPLGAHLLREACRWGQEWHSHFPQLHLNLNVSPRQFHESSFVDRVRTQLTESGLSPERLSLELTESILLEESEACIERLERLADLGIRLVLDDFGTGYTSLAHLVRLPIQALKIDRRFVLGISDPDPAVAAHCESVVKSTVALAATRNLDVTAVGIEDAQIQARLVALGADYGQGYHVGRPMPEADVLPFLSASQIQPLRLAA